MTDSPVFWQLGALSNEQVLGGLARTLGSHRRLTAALVAHLGEVEERRLHLDAACSSMFSYCVSRLGLSEDEACRRIDVARLARRFPAIFPLLATGDLSLSVAALLKPHLTNENASRLLAAVSGKSVLLAREALAALFPRADVPTTIRRLPGSLQSHEPLRSVEARSEPLGEDELSLFGVAVTREVAPPRDAPTRVPRVEEIHPAGSSPRPSMATTAGSPSALPTTVAAQVPHRPERDAPAVQADAGRSCVVRQPVPTAAQRGGDAPSDRGTRSGSFPRTPVKAQSIAPLAASRYKVQFTADGELKAKLELARDLMRHAVPDGDFAIIIGRALDRLIADLMKKQFGVRATKAEPGTPSPSTPPPDVSARNSDDPFSNDCVSSMGSSSMGSSSMGSSSMGSSSMGSSSMGSSSMGSSSMGSSSMGSSSMGSSSMDSSSMDSSSMDSSSMDSSSMDSASRFASPSPLAPARGHVATSARGHVATSARGHVARAVRRAVVERDGVRCGYVDARGLRCEERAWLEYDHHHPLGKGGGSTLDNMRLLCRAHNRRAAELEYGRDRIESAIAKRQRRARCVRESSSPAHATPEEALER